MNHGWYTPNFHPYSGFALLGNFLIFALMLALLILLIVWLVRSLGRSPLTLTQTPKNNGALEIARERYAKGEIDLNQFQEIKKNLENP